MIKLLAYGFRQSFNIISNLNLHERLELKSGSVKKLYKVFDIFIQNEHKCLQVKNLDMKSGVPDLYVMHMLSKLTPNLIFLPWNNVVPSGPVTSLYGNICMHAFKNMWNR